MTSLLVRVLLIVVICLIAGQSLAVVGGLLVVYFLAALDGMFMTISSFQKRGVRLVVRDGAKMVRIMEKNGGFDHVELPAPARIITIAAYPSPETNGIKGKGRKV